MAGDICQETSLWGSGFDSGFPSPSSSLCCPDAGAVWIEITGFRFLISVSKEQVPDNGKERHFGHNGLLLHPGLYKKPPTEELRATRASLLSRLGDLYLETLPSASFLGIQNSCPFSLLRNVIPAVFKETLAVMEMRK